jgi:hypothetical protein
MSKFVCFGDDCPNKDVVYDFGDDNPASCECGGCHVMLIPVEESADE